eukprot:Amastigsp_a855185_10.p5 type:complete len:106 gc:universal Amastigsp_a855185_10:354-37(-)
MAASVSCGCERCDAPPSSSTRFSQWYLTRRSLLISSLRSRIFCSGSMLFCISAIFRVISLTMSRRQRSASASVSTEPANPGRLALGSSPWTTYRRYRLSSEFDFS